MRNLKKKLQQIDALQSRQQENQLDPQQQAKLAQRAELTATLEALQSGCSLEDAQQAAQPAKQFSSASCDWLPRSSSNLSLDSSASKRKPRASKHRAPTSQLSRLSMTASDQHTAQDDTAGPDDMSSVMDSTHAQPMSSSSTKLDAERDLSSAADPEQSLAEAAPPEAPLPVPSAWQRPSDASAGFTISGFSTPQGTKATGTAWPSPSGGAVGVPAEASHTPAASPASGSIGSRAKPPRKGGLSMFLSGAALAILAQCHAQACQAFRPKSDLQGVEQQLSEHAMYELYC